MITPARRYPGTDPNPVFLASGTVITAASR